MTYFAALTGLLVGSAYGYIAQPSRAVRSPRSGPSEKRNDDLGTTRCGCDATGYSTDWSVRYGRFVHAIQG